MLEYGRGTVVELMCLICDLAWRQREVPDEWKNAIIVPLYKNKNKCSNYSH